MESYFGLIKTPQDAFLIFEGARQGLIKRRLERLSQRERNNIRSGSVFVWDEKEATIQRWTDGISWSASRSEGSFLIYHEIQPRRRNHNNSSNMNSRPNFDSKRNQLLKRAVSVMTQDGRRMHLVSYVRSYDLAYSTLAQPSMDNNLNHLKIPQNYYFKPTLTTVPKGTTSAEFGSVKSIQHNQFTPQLSQSLNFSPSINSHQHYQSDSFVNYHNSPKFDNHHNNQQLLPPIQSYLSPSPSVNSFNFSSNSPNSSRVSPQQILPPLSSLLPYSTPILNDHDEFTSTSNASSLPSSKHFILPRINSMGSSSYSSAHPMLKEDQRQLQALLKSGSSTP